MYCSDRRIECGLLKRVAQQPSVNWNRSLALAASEERVLPNPVPKLVRTHCLLPNRCWRYDCKGTFGRNVRYTVHCAEVMASPKSISRHEAGRGPSRQ